MKSFQEKLKELDELERKATAGPFICDYYDESELEIYSLDGPMTFHLYQSEKQNRPMMTKADAQFIAASRNLCREMLAMLASQQAALITLNEEIEALTHEGRQGELEKANADLATENQKLRTLLLEVREELRASNAWIRSHR